VVFTRKFSRSLVNDVHDMYIRAMHCPLSHDTIRIPIRVSRYDTYHDTVNTSISASTYQITRQNKNINMDILLPSTIVGGF